MSIKYGTRVHPAIDGTIDFSIRGSIIEHPAIDPKGVKRADLAMVHWDDDTVEVAPTANLVTVEAWISV